MMEASFLTRHPRLKDIGGFVIFVVCVIVGTLLINTFVFRSFSVTGPSMEQTLYTGDRLIVNRLPVTMAHLQNNSYTPKRGQIIVFKNPLYSPGSEDMNLVKRVIAFAGERVTVKDGTLTVYNKEHPQGFHPDDSWDGPGSPTSGDTEVTVPEGSIFVAGDHRQGSYSLDSRNGLGTVPLYDVIGPVSLRLWPLTKVQGFQI
ncbi:MAG: signal peptidase I [Candidatus Saccharibacteria bacterium]|jgi:signal peptidase I|nr:signal peptidase I [Candidatus Saccharibacteria bacterium]